MKVGDPELRKFYIEYFDQLMSQDFPAETYELVCELAGWCQWLLDRLYSISELPEGALTEQLQLVGARLDSFLYTSPEEFRSKLIARSWPADEANLFIDTLLHCQRDLKARLARRGVERIEAEVGRAFEPGVVNRREGEGEATSDSNLHDRIARLEPGDGGYRINGRVLFPSRAVRYVYAEA